MTEADRTRLRKLQDDWLALPSVRHYITLHGEDAVAVGGEIIHRLTFRDIRTMLLPEWEHWFRARVARQLRKGRHDQQGNRTAGGSY